ncbi:Transcription accessory protein (S1 RNA-binding domain) [Halanaerobium saccharolyticum subsp. saccharolyticum DSM 6643]|uniref:Transcription accessory protein (S1 RNA-binding domain) n=1 Tax=Halanaerobium saccharolyticum subsp. saccharolyticum DSM 6643 TaxID=1293054 RepID=M5DXP4_9FIRM|nr:Tex family protein [Halanaerobium saccharolyticum]CCU77593.1 Transcription accessory protein (S1 RNA-binding domain) [Halanaerobium saccharolyticum subsp. saccharolyticum DSM 6643]
MSEYIKVDLFKLAASKLNLKKENIKTTVELLDAGNTVPFIARYRKEMTGSLDEEEIRNIEEKIDYLRRLNERKNDVAAAADKQDKLDEEILNKLKKADTLQEVEDLYRPFKVKKQTKAAKAIEKGLKPLADLIFNQEKNAAEIKALAQEQLDPEKELKNIEDVLSGAEDIIAGEISDDAELRKKLRDFVFKTAKITSEQKNEDEEGKYQDYYEFKESINKIPPHRILALNRGENEDILRVKVEVDDDRAVEMIYNLYEFDNRKSGTFEHLVNGVDYAYKRLIFPSLEREVRNHLTEKAEEKAVNNFSTNLKSLLMQPPLEDQRVLAVDPAFRTGCKLAALAEDGQLLDTGAIYPHPPVNKQGEAAEMVAKLVKKHEIDIIVIGNGTASRETETFIAELIKSGMDVEYTIVSEAGASVYSASKLARKEFPDLDVSIRGAISIGRRIQDPLAELVKIDPKSLGVGMYQHDISQKRLEKALNEVVIDAVNHVGVEINTASAALLTYVAGISSNNAEKIIEHRSQNGEFKERKELLDVYGFGPKTYEQAAGFIRLNSKEDPFAITPIHPESYRAAEKILENINYIAADIRDKEKLNQVREKLNNIDLVKIATDLEIGLPTAKDIVASLKQPGRDPRDSMPAPIFRKDILKIEDIKSGMIFKGKVRNIVDFGAFVDIGLKQDGLLHISEMSQMYVSDPFEIVEIGQNIEVKVLDVDQKRGRISLTLKF